MSTSKLFAEINDHLKRATKARLIRQRLPPILRIQFFGSVGILHKKMFERQTTKLLLFYNQKSSCWLLCGICLIREVHHVILTEQRKDEG
ncbi:unnamed protein product [Sphagnum troendelagicum]